MSSNDIGVIISHKSRNGAQSRNLKIDKHVVQQLKLHLASWEVHGDKTNEPACLMKHLLGHWEVENCLHLQQDRYFSEDKHVVKRNGWDEAWTVLTNRALSLGQMPWRGERTVKEVRERYYSKPVPTAKKLAWKNKTC